MIYDNPKVIIFHLLNYTSHFVTKLHGAMKQKLALLGSRINVKNRVFVVPYHISRQRIVIANGRFSCRYNSKIVLLNQNACANELNIVSF